MIIPLGIFVCLSVHFTVANIVAKRLGLTKMRAPAQVGERGATAHVWLAQLAGPVAAYSFASLLFFMALQLAGADAPPSVIAVPDEPAAKAGLESGDRVLTVAGSPVSSWDELAARVLAAPRDRETAIVAERRGLPITVLVTPDANGRIGIRAGEEPRPRAWQSSLGPALSSPLLLPFAYFQSLWAKVGGAGAAPGRPVKAHGPLPAWKAWFILLAPSVPAAWPVTLLAAAVFVPRRRDA